MRAELGSKEKLEYRVLVIASEPHQNSPQTKGKTRPWRAGLLVHPPGLEPGTH